ncbi:MAG: endonuclease [Alicyclobacillus sp.]|nr:endonuclease [Alicyclobacillus sp.]
MERKTRLREEPLRGVRVKRGPYGQPGPVERTRLQAVYRMLEDAYGDLHWWPADSQEEMVIGAILVQDVSWKNTQRALQNLAQAGLLSFTAMRAAGREAIARHIVPTRFFNRKAERLLSFADHLALHHGGSLADMLRQPLEPLRAELLGIRGIGRETADDIVLYGAGHPSFVVDAYTQRILTRLGLIDGPMPYESLRTWVMARLPRDAQLFNQFHALLDRLGSRVCLSQRPKCKECPLRAICPTASAEAEPAD